MTENRSKILVIDDDTRLRNLLGKYLEDNNFIVFSAKDTLEGEAILAQNNFDALIVDVMMQGEDGISFTKRIREISKVPILILTARGESGDRIDGLLAGADDYMPKPFEPKELLLRINNILKRSSAVNANQGTNIQFGDFIFNLSDLRLKKNGEYIHLPESEAKILSILGQNLGVVVSRERLSELCGDIDERSIDVQITRLRRKIETSPKQPQFLQTVRNQGYILRS